MTDSSPNLDLPYLIASQAQKHVTFNELVNKIDTLLMLSVNSLSLATPPANPVEGQRYIIPTGATDAWQNQAGKIAVWQNLGWAFSTPKNGFIAFADDDKQVYFYNGSWNKLSQTPTYNFPKIGIGSDADNINLFSAKLNNALFAAKYSYETGDGNIRIVTNKQTAANTASYIFQNNWSGRAEIGLLGDDSFGIKTSADGSNWVSPLKLDASGGLNFINLIAPAIIDGNNEIIKRGNTRFLLTPKAINTEGLNLFIGDNSGSLNLIRTAANTDASRNISIGNAALSSLTSGYRNMAIGVAALQNTTTGYYNTAVGTPALTLNTTGVGNTAIGASSGGLNNTGHYNSYFGHYAGYSNNSGSSNSAFGMYALRYKVDGTDNNSFSNCCGIGYDARVSASNQVQLGGSGTTTYAYGAVQDRSDIRDKADIRNTILGLEFINALRPVDFKWDMREDYCETINISDEDGTIISKLVPIEKDGSKKRNRYHHGLIAQEVEQVMQNLGVDFGGYQNHSLKDGVDILSIGYTELIAPLIKSIQELNTRLAQIEQSISQ